MSESSSDDLPSYGMEAIISTIDAEKELLDKFRIECENQRKKLNYLNEQTDRKQGNKYKKNNKNIIKLSADTNISMD
jgi:predicted phage gp36 major capsid-like protein